MSGAAVGGLITLSAAIRDLADVRVVSLPDARVDALAMTMARDEAGPAAVVAGPTGEPRTPADVVRAAVDRLERVAVELLPAWLPDAAAVDRPDISGVAATRRAATAYAQLNRYPVACLTDLALLAVTGQRPASKLPLHVRVATLTRLVAAAFGRAQVVLLLDLDGGGDPALPAAGAQWLAGNGGPAVWLVGRRAAELEHIAQARFDPPPVPETPVDIGRPHPGSAVEKMLEAALAAESWAAGRRWNQTYQSHALASPVRLDLFWPEDRCVVELDGPEHCHPVRFEADRQRDVQLQLDGHAVLRFTNARVLHDVGAVVHQIGSYLLARRRERAEGRSHGRR